MTPDFFAHDPFPPGVPYVEPRPKEEDRFLHCARWLVTACLSGKTTDWSSCPEFRELCALISLPADPPPDDDHRPDIPPSYRRLLPHEIVTARDKWRPHRRRPSAGRITLPFETVPPGMIGLPVHRSPVRALFIRAESL